MLVKIPSLAMIPLILVLVWSAGRRPGLVLLWLVPAILIAAVWPASAALTGDFGGWVDGVLWQADRDGQNRLDGLQEFVPHALVQGEDPDILTHPMILLHNLLLLFRLDPVLMSLGAAGLVFAVAMRNRFLLLWIVPVLLFFGSIGFVSYFHLGMLWTAMCVAAAAMIAAAIGRVPPGAGNRMPPVAVFTIAVIGLSISGIMIYWDATSAQMNALSFTLERYADAEVFAMTYGSSILRAHGLDTISLTGGSTREFVPTKTEKIIILADSEHISYYRSVSRTESGGAAPLEADGPRRLLEIYDGGQMTEFRHGPIPDVSIPLGHIGTYVGDIGAAEGVVEWSPPGWALLPTYGPRGQALNLDGTTYVTLADTPGLDLGGGDPFSIAFWIKMLGPGNPDSSIISKADAALQQGLTVLVHPHGKVSLRMTDGASDQITVNTFSSVSDGRWHHVVFTYDGSMDRGGLDVHVDGQIDNLRWHSTSLSGSAGNDHPLAIGASSTGKVPAQDTVLDDIRIYSVQLPAGYMSDVHECHVEMAVLAAGGDGSAGDHACMGDYDDALLVHLEFEGDLSDSSGGGGGTAHGDVRYTSQTRHP